MPSLDIEINFVVNSDELASAQADLQELVSSADEISASTQDIDTSTIEEMGESASETGENIKSASESMEELGGKTEETNQKMQETAESSAGIGTAIAGIGGAVGLDMMIQTGDNINTSWNRLSLTFDGTGVSMDQLKQKSAELNASTGQSGGTIRNYFNQMGIAGITNTELLGSSFEALSGKAFQTGNSFESMQQKMNGMVMTGTASGKMLKSLGITTEDLGEAMGVSGDEATKMFKSLSEEERLKAITTAMGDGTKANEMYKNSYAGLKSQAETSLAGLTGAIGQSMLPIIIPALNTARSVVNGLTGAWKSLPAPVQQVFGGLGAGVVTITAVTGTLGVLGSVGSSVLGGLRSLRTGFDALRGAMSTARLMTDALRNAESISQGVRSALALATGTATTVEEANAVAKASAVAPTGALAVAENLLLSPIVLVTLAIIGLIAVLYYLYNNNEQVRMGINSLIGQFQEFIGMVINAGQQILAFVSSAISSFIRWTDTSSTLVSQFVRRVISGLSSLPSQVSNALSGLTHILTKPFEDAWRTISPIVDGIKNGVGTVQSWFSGVDFAGFNEDVGFAGFDDSLNGALTSIANNSNTSTVTNNFNITGLIEEEASQYIVSSVNNHLKKQNLVRGV